MSKSPLAELRKTSSISRKNKEPNGNGEMDDPEKTVSRVSQLLDQLHANVSSPQERELTTARLLGIAKARKEARALIGNHGQAMPLFVSILRDGTPLAKVNVASTLAVLCRNEDLRVKVLLGGCIPPLLTIVKSEAIETRKAAAEALCEVSSGGLSDVGMQIFITEGVVPKLWEQLTPKRKQDQVVEGYLTGALRNLCGDSDGYWQATLDAGGVDIVLRLISSSNSVAQANAASLLSRLVLTFSDSIPKIINSEAIKIMLRLLSEHKDVSVRASAAEALDALSLKSTEARKKIVDADGVFVLIGAIVAPSKEGVQGELSEVLQQHSMQTLSNIRGGKLALILYLGELAQSPRLAAPVADIIGALAYTLTVFKQSDGEETFESAKTENILIMLLKPRDNKHVQVRLLEALSCLYSNTYLSVRINQSEAKRVLVGLITMTKGDAQEYLITCLIRLCTEGLSVWEALGKREGIQLLISSLGLSSEEHQEYIVEMLTILIGQVDDSKWAITAAGGIPPLVRLIEVGSWKAKEDATHLLSDLCSHSEEIRACVERAKAVPAFLWLLQNGGPNAQEASAIALTNLIKTADSATINQLLSLLLGDIPSSKASVIQVLGHVLSVASNKELINKGGAAYKALKSLVEVLNSSNAKTQEHAATVLADIFSNRKDICDSLATDEIVNPYIRLLTSKTPWARVLAVLSRTTKANAANMMSYIAEGDVKSLIKLAKTSSIDNAVVAMAALANMLSDPKLAAEALDEDIVSAITRVLGEGSSEGKKSASDALHQLLKLYSVGDVLKEASQCRFAILAIVDSLSAMDVNSKDADDALDVLSLLSRIKHGRTAYPSSLEPLVNFLCNGPPPIQDKAIEILSRLSADQPIVVGDSLVSNLRSFGALASRILKSSSLEVRVGATTLIVCGAKEGKFQSMEALDSSGYMKPLICALVDMMKQNSSCSSREIEVETPRGLRDRSAFRDGNNCDVLDLTTVSGSTVASWLLSIVSSSHLNTKITVMEAGGLEALYDKLWRRTNKDQVKLGDSEEIWIGTLLAAILFREASIVSSPTALRFIPLLTNLLKSAEMIDRFFAAQAMASFVCHGDKRISLTIANSGIVAGLTTLIGHVELDRPNLIALSEEVSLPRNPDQVVLETLFQFDDVRVGPVARTTIPLLVDMLKPIPDRPGAPPFAVRLLTHIADGNDGNKLLMAEAGALDSLTKYLSLSPQDLTEATISELFRILFSNDDILQYEAATRCLNQLVAVLHLGSRSARLSAVKALDELFNADHIRDSDASLKAIQPLADMLNTSSEQEQKAALSALIKLTADNDTNGSMLAEVEGDPLHILYSILISNSDLELKSDASELCCVLFSYSHVRKMPIASECVQPLVMLMQSDMEIAVESGVCAFERLLENEQQLQMISVQDLVGLLVDLISGSNHRLIEASICALIKLGKDKTPRKLDMVNAGLIDNCLELLPTAPESLCATIVELFRILTNSSVISKTPAAAKIIEPLLMVLKTDFGTFGQHSALQALVNVLEKPQTLSTLKLTPSQVIEPLIPFLESSSQALQQLSTELLSYLLAQEHFKQDITTKGAVSPLVQLAGIGILSLQQTAIKSLASISRSWPKAVVDAGGVFELSKLITQSDPLPPEDLWESTAMVLSNLLESDTDYYFTAPIVALVRMLQSSCENTMTVALNALIIREKTDASSAELMAEAGAIDSLLDLLRSHHSEESSGKLLEALFNNMRVREMKACKHAIAPLAQYLLDPQTTSESGKLLAALSICDLSQHEGLAKASDSVYACRALIALLKDQPTEEITVVSVCALQNFVMRGRTNRRLVAEAGGVVMVQDLLQSSNPEISAQAALLIKILFSNHTLQEYVSNDLIMSLTAALEKELQSTPVTVNEEVLKTINIILSNFHKLHISEGATLCVPHLVAALKSGSEAAQDSILTTLCLLKQSWSTMPFDVSRSQATAAAEAIPTLQALLKSCHPSFRERVVSLLNCLPGCLTVTVKRANNLKQDIASINAYFRLSIGNSPPKRTKTSREDSPEWQETFTWAFDTPPRGQRLNIACRNKSTFGKNTLGRVAIQIDKVVNEGAESGIFNLVNDNNRDESSRTVEIDLSWSNS